LNIDLKWFNLGSLWPHLIRSASEVPPYTHPSIHKSTVPYNLQSWWQLENLLAHFSYGQLGLHAPRALREVTFNEVLAEFRRRKFLNEYQGDDAEILKDKKRCSELDQMWNNLYKLEGEVDRPYRNNWEKDLKEIFKDRKDVVYIDSSTIKIGSNVTYLDIIKEIRKAEFISKKWESFINKSDLDLASAKAAWDEIQAKKAWTEAQNKLAVVALEKEAKAKAELDAAQAKKVWDEAKTKKAGLYEAQFKQAALQEAQARKVWDEAQAKKVFMENQVKQAALDEVNAKKVWEEAKTKKVALHEAQGKKPIYLKRKQSE
jgi:hypothetical protein